MSIRRAGKRFLKWGGPVVAVLLAVVWWMSGKWYAAYIWPGDWVFRVERGVSGVAHWPGEAKLYTGFAPPVWYLVPTKSTPFLWWFYAKWEPDHQSASVPLWFPFVIVVGLSAAVWRRDWLAKRRALLGHCVKCHYDRRGLAVAAPCPECGAAEQVR